MFKILIIFAIMLISLQIIQAVDLHRLKSSKTGLKLNNFSSFISVKLKCYQFGKIEQQKLQHCKDAFIDFVTALDDNHNRVLNYYGLMFAGAVARSVAVVSVHPLNVIKTIMQCENGQISKWSWSALTRGAGAQLLMSVPHGALNFAVTEVAVK